MKLRQRWRQTSIANKLIIIISGAAAVFTLLGVMPAYLQYLLAEQESADNSAQANRLIESVKRVVNQAEASARSGITAQERIAKKAADLNKQSVDAAIEAVRLAREANALNAQSARLDQRAWVSVRTATFNNPIEAGKPASLTYRITNTGRSPALHVRLSEANSSFDAPCESTHRHEPPRARAVSDSVIAPGAEYTLGYQTVPLLQTELTRVTGEDRGWFFWGSLDYRDVFNEPHTTRFCMAYSQRLMTESKTLGWCPCHNDVE